MEAAPTFAGVDFAANPKDTWIAVGKTDAAGRLQITEIRGNISDGEMIVISRAGHRVFAIDAPFGWPDGFVSFVSDYHMGRTPGSVKRLDFRFRKTDKFIHETVGKWPLSASTDRLGIVAHRLTSILSEFTDCDVPPFREAGRRTMAIEVYPAATLLALGIDPTGYKKEPNIRREVLRQLSAFGLDVPSDLATLCVDGDDALDAAICALTGHLHSLGETVGPPDGAVVRKEGWIFVPKSRVKPP